jgi:hypothetical protein
LIKNQDVKVDKEYMQAKMITIQIECNEQYNIKQQARNGTVRTVRTMDRLNKPPSS